MRFCARITASLGRLRGNVNRNGSETMITEPPFRAEHVGSLLRPQDIKDARAKREQGQISAEDLKAIEDKAISRAVAKEARSV